MEKILTLTRSGGKVDIFEDLEKNLYLAKPYGIINPSLIKVDLREAASFARKNKCSWTYITNTENLLFPNPLNLLYLRKIKKLSRIGEIVIFAPNLLTKLLLLSAAFIIRPDKVFTRKEDFEKFMTLRLA